MLVALLLLAAPEPSRLAATAFVCDGFTPELCESLFDRFIARLEAAGVKVTNQKDIALALGLERQKQLLGCDEESNCLVEIASALAVDGIVSGSVAETRDGYLVTVKVVRAKNGTKWKTFSRRAPTETHVRDELEDLADEIGHAQVLNASAKPALVGAISFAALAAVGGALYGISQVNAATLRSTVRISNDGVTRLATQGSALQAVGLTFLCIGLPLAIAAATWALLGYRAYDPIGVAW